MKLRIALAASALAVAAVGTAGASAAPRSAGAEVGNACSGQATATLGAGLWAVGLGPEKTTTFTINITCVAGTRGSVSASGTLTGRCGRSTGTGTIDGQPFTLETAGTALILTPRNGSTVVGTGNAVSDPTVANNSCTNGTATKFLVTGAVHW